MGLLYVRIGRKTDAVALLRRAALLAPANPQYVYTYAVALAETGKGEESRRVVEAALQRFPEYAPLREEALNRRAAWSEERSQRP
jgi:Flp pilus assembly protein TadD